MAEVLNMSDLFDPKLVKSLFNQVTGKSSVAALCGQTPIEFTGNKVMIFSMDNEVALVGEGEPRTHGGISVAPVKIVPVEIEYGARVSARFMDASEEEQLDILEAFSKGFADKVARGIDIMSMHGVNPRTGETSLLPVDGMFEAVGQLPEQTISQSLSLAGEDGFLACGEDCVTSVPGIFAAGDCRSKEVRQLTTACADGACAAVAAAAYCRAH